MLMVSGFRSFDLEYLGFAASEEVSRQIQQDEDKSSSEDISILSAVYEAIVPVYKIQVAVVYNNVLELELIEEIQETISVKAPLTRSTYLQILFRTFISPNAP